MKYVIFALLVSSAFCGNSFATSDLGKLAGIYRSDEGTQFSVSVNGRTVSLRTNAELSRYRLCRTPVATSTNVVDSNDGFAEARFDVTRSGCSRMDGPITLHYNRTIFGTDVYLIDVVIRQGHGRDRGQTMRWHLTKIHN